MALKSCRECKKKVSTEASVCPKCGVPDPTKKIEQQLTTMDIMCYYEKCDRWLHPVNVPKKTLGQYICQSCGGGMKHYSKRIAKDDKRRIEEVLKNEVYSKKFDDERLVSENKKVYYSDQYGWSFPFKYILLAIPALIGLMYFENSLIIVVLMFYLFGCVIGFIKGDR